MIRDCPSNPRAIPFCWYEGKKNFALPLISSTEIAVINLRVLLFICGMEPKAEFTAKQLANLGQRLKQLRKEKGFGNYEKFAFHHDINRVQYGRYETGKDLRFSSLLKVIHALDMTVEEFFSEGFGEEEV